MTWRDRDPALRKSTFAEPEARTKGPIGTVAHDQAPTVPSVPFVPAMERAKRAADHLAERAAIIQEGAGVPADWAEGFAQLEASQIPSWVDAIAWQAMIDAAGRFIDAWGAKAAAAGWTAAELFGLDKAAPMRRPDRRGAAFFLVDARVIDVTADAITIRKGGKDQCIRHRDGFTVPAWENFK